MKKHKTYIEIYYSEEADIMCIVESDAIWKYVGQFADPVAALCFPIDEWYAADNHPQHFKSFKLIGEL